MIAFCCGAYVMSFLAVRQISHSTIDDMPEMRRWKQVRKAMAACLIAGDFGCAILAWLSPWAGYAAGLATIAVFVGLRTPAEAEELFRQRAAAESAAA